MTPSLPATVRFVERDWLSSNLVFLVDGPDATVVDTGYAKHAPLTAAIVERLLTDTDTRLTRIVNTHLHSDHCGGNALLAQRFGARILVPEASLADVTAWDEQALTFAATGQRCDRFHADDGIAPGATLTMGGLQWQALAAPGHDPKSLVFHCPEARLLISADALWGNGFGVLFPELEGESGFAEQQAILELIAGLDVATVLPGHGPAFDDVGAAIDRAFARLRALRAEPSRVYRNGLKVLIKFLILDREQADTEAFVAHLCAAPLMRQIAAMLAADPEQMIRAGIAELVAQGQLEAGPGWLRNREAAAG
jgi:glyoxylase-like metal-dependent hydrolase (beta-lactamase superfamily II)